MPAVQDVNPQLLCLPPATSAGPGNPNTFLSISFLSVGALYSCRKVATTLLQMVTSPSPSLVLTQVLNTYLVMNEREKPDSSFDLR